MKGNKSFLLQKPELQKPSLFYFCSTISDIRQFHRHFIVLFCGQSNTLWEAGRVCAGFRGVYVLERGLVKKRRFRRNVVETETEFLYVSIATNTVVGFARFWTSLHDGQCACAWYTSTKRLRFLVLLGWFSYSQHQHRQGFRYERLSNLIQRLR